MEMKRFNYLLQIDILRNSSQKILGVLRVAFLGFGCPKRHPDALLAKTMMGPLFILRVWFHFTPILLVTVPAQSLLESCTIGKTPTVNSRKFRPPQASTLTQIVIGPVGPVTL